MAQNIQLLKQVRKAATRVNQTTNNPEHKALMTAADAVFNELILQDKPEFYLNHLAQGKRLLAEGHALLATLGTKTSPQQSLRSFNDDVRTDVVMEEITRLSGQLVDVVELLDESRSSTEKSYLVRLGDWENSLYQHRMEATPNPADTLAKDLQPDDLLAYLQRKFPQWKKLELLNFAPLAGGFSKKTILFETEDDVNGHQAMVMRAEQGADLLGYEGSDVTQEFHTIQLMRRAGIPVAEPLWLEADASQLGMRFIVSRKAIGKTQGGNMGSDEPVSAALIDCMLTTMIKLHGIRLEAQDPLVQKSHLGEWMHCKTVTDAQRFCVTELFPRLARKTGIAMTPQLLRGLKWLQRNVPEVDEPAAIVHIDFAFNNLIIDKDQITAVLDWESSRLGDPAEEITWTQQSLASHITLPDFLERYERETGRRISEYRIAYCKVQKCALNALCILSALRILDTDDTANISLGVLGLRYMAIFASQFNPLIEAAEEARRNQ